jgi:hypothetical protein
MGDKILRARRRKAAGCGDIQMRAHIESRSRETAVCLRERQRKVEAHEENRGILRFLNKRMVSLKNLAIYRE